jgi:allantoate deiminase
MASGAQASQVIRVCRLLAACSEETGVTTRTFLSPPMRDVHATLAKWMTDAGMSVRVDAAGNLRGVYPGSSAGAPPLLIGSHLDTVPRAGAFDGVLGVVLGVALVDLLDRKRLPFPIEVIGFSEEEGVRFGVPFIGSRALVGTIDAELLNRRDQSGRSVRQAIADFGLDAARLSDARIERAMGYVEFHIEQGPVLEQLDLPLAVVDTIVGQTRVEVIFTGASGHAGTTPMESRRDALAAAAEWIGAVEREALGTPGLVATVGRVDSEPGSANVIAGRARALLDIRHADDRIRVAAVDRLRQCAGAIAGRRGIDVGWHPYLDQPAVEMSRTLVSALERAVSRSGIPVHRLSSGAGHDAMIMASRMPAAMVFLRTPGGISHHPDESVREEDVGIALAAARHFLDELTRSVV